MSGSQLPQRKDGGSRVRMIGGGAVVIACVALLVAVPATFPPDGGPTAFDRVITEAIHSFLNGHRGIAEALVVVSNGYILLPLLLLGAIWFAVRHDFGRAVLLVVVPESVVGVNTWLLKPLWGRHFHDYLAYPSGHTVHLVSIVTAFVILATARTARMLLVMVGALALLAAAVGMIALDYHLPTDIVGGTAFAVAATSTLCALMLGALRTQRRPATPA